MSERITRISLAEAIDGDRTDWDRIRALSDADIDAAIASNADTFSIDAPKTSGARFQILQGKSGEWLWRLVAVDGEILANGQPAFASRASAIAAVKDLRRAIAGTSDDIAA